MKTTNALLADQPDFDGVLYYPGSGTDLGPLQLFAGHGGYKTVVYVDYMLKFDQVVNFLEHLPGWRLDGPPEKLDPRHFNARSWLDFWPKNRQSWNFASPTTAFSLQTTLRSPSDKPVKFVFFATEAIQTYSMLADAGIHPTAIVLHDHGWGCNWASFGGDSPLYKRALNAPHMPRYLLVADGDTQPWQGYERVSEYQVYDGEMHIHPRAVFELQR